MTPTSTPLLPASVDPDHAALWQRLQADGFGEGETALAAFERRVAEEAGVSPALATHLVEEYRRFCFLACVAGEEITPSPLVDQAWHAHLTDTREYWQRFCPQILRRTLHHHPGRGDPADAARFQAQYAATLAQYRHYFGEPPTTCWPAPAGTRPPAPAPRQARTRRTAPTRGGIALWGWMLGVALLFAVLWQRHGPLSPLHWPGPSFLLLFLACIGLAWSLGARLRLVVRGLRRAALDTPLDATELAYLAGGSERVADQQLALLLAAGAVRLQAEPHVRRQARLQSTTVAVPPTLQRALAIVRAHPQLQQALAALRRDAAPLRRALVDKGLWLGHGQALCARLFGAAPLLALWMVGLLKLRIGLQLQRPIGFLVAAMVVVAVVALGFLLTPPRRSVAGDALLAERDAAWRDGVAAPSPEPGSHLALPLALAGTSVLMTTPWADYHALRSPLPNGAGCSASTSSCGGGGGSSDGGGSSCGGGGCGGCGGGD
ncbi:TIGR04222 domain-containing membrane protein [Xanthomonas sacchari]|uniref:TIGR04222 domain-containing membrane protein n=1 Tax=Xanthomonas sacchari TaxID=56458 RepID=UPI00225C19E9|nr:TIGR04222 domain-containing membrane protein [Xanthomonas sacchari]UYK84555.1 TIGR04222 domain-containing membrane protein [Xanthomonas sacchari]